VSDALDRAEDARQRGASIGPGTLLWGRLDLVRPELVTIGRGCQIAPEAIVLCHGSPDGWQPVTIGDYVYVGLRAVILPGAVIGDDVVIGAGAVVPRARPIPPRVVAAGNPARVVRQRTPEEITEFRRKMARWQPDAA